jgi:hypothetical protein
MLAQLLVAGNFLGVLGNELWIEGTKHIGGLIAVRRGTSSIAPENLPVLRCGDSETEGQHMVQPPSSEITGLLRAWSHGDEDALARVVKLVYPELRDIARRCLSRERPGHTIQATALVHEAYLRLVDIRQVQWQDRAHFFPWARESCVACSWIMPERVTAPNEKESHVAHRWTMLSFFPRSRTP